MNLSALGSLNAPLLSTRVEQSDQAAPLLELTTRLARGDDAAWTAFHREYGPAVFRQLLAASRGDHDLATEALQQTYLRVARHARPCECERMFVAWLRLVARTALSDCRRRRSTFWNLLRRHSDATGSLDSSADLDARLEAALKRALTLLSPDDRALLEAKYFSGADVRTIAARLNISAKAVESRLTRARAELRGHLSAALANDE